MTSKKISSALIAGLFVFLTACSFKENALENRVVLKVNNSSLSSKEFAEQIANKLKVYDAFSLKDKAIINNAKKDVINNFIVKTITQDWAKENNLFVRQEDLDKEILSIRSAYSDDLSFRRALAKENKAFNEWKEQVSFSILEKIVIEKINQELVQPTDEEIKSHYKTNKSDFTNKEMVQLRQIILDTESNAKRVLQEFRRGKSFKHLARKYSIGPEAKNDGKTAWIEKGAMKVFDSAFNMGRGQVSKIIKSPYGFHIYTLIDKKRAKKMSLKEAKPLIVQRLLEKRQKALYSSWLEKQLRKARVLEDEAFIKQIKVETRGT